MTHDGEPDSYEYASRLATWIWEKHYKNESPHWKPLNDLLGVLTQIDNMVTGLVRAQPEQEPVAWLYVVGESRYVHGHQIDEYYSLDGGETRIKGIPLYTAPPQREWIGLTDEERTYLAWESNNAPGCVAMTEAKLKEKNGNL